MRPKRLRTATALTLLWPAMSVHAADPGWTCFPSADGGWDCRDADTATAIPPRPPTPIGGRLPAEYTLAPGADPVQLYIDPNAPTGPAEVADATDSGPSGEPTSPTAGTVADAVAVDQTVSEDIGTDADGVTTDTIAVRDEVVAEPLVSNVPANRLANPDASRVNLRDDGPLAISPRATPVSTQLNQDGYLGALFAARPDRATLEYVNPWAVCGSPPVEVRPEQPPEASPIDIIADENQIYDEEIAEFKGNVEFVQGHRIIKADFLRFNIAEDELEMIGTTYMKDFDIEVWGNYAKFDMGQDEGNIQKAGYRLASRHAQGRADKIWFEEHGDITRLRESTYSTCPAVQEDWVLESDSLVLNHPENEGVARDATLRFKGVPVMWSPYMSFPLSPERKSGFLRPRVGYDADDGIDVTIPYYWNIAPNQDATIGTRVIGKRGVQGQGQYRFLTKRQSGEISAEYMPNDDIFDDYRAAASFQSRGEILPRLHSDINVNWASDDDYFRDLGNNLTITSVQFLERRGDLEYRGDGWNLLGRAQEFQTLDSNLARSSRPYKRLPQFLFETTYPQRWGRAEFDLRAEAVNWGHDDNVEGQRFDIEPAVSMPFTQLWGFVTPRVAARYTSYNLSNRDDGGPDSINRFLPIASIDSGLFFERDTKWGGKGITQTIEPRLFYLYIPEDNQDDIPLFDTADQDFSFAQMFQENRFTGADRVGDANQLTAAITTRLLESESGAERLSMSLGQIYYFEDREVTINGGPAETDSSSEIVFGLTASPGAHWNINFDYQYDPHAKVSTKTAARINYKRDWDHIVNLSYRKRQTSSEQVSVDQIGASAYWGFGPNWKVITNVAYDLDSEDNGLVEVLGGVHYDTCCWSAMLAYRQFVQENDTENRSNILLMFELKGLGRYGQELYDLMERGILGYNAPPETPL